MIFGGIGRADDNPLLDRAVAAALELYGGKAAVLEPHDRLRLAAGRHAELGGNRGCYAAFLGWIDNAQELARDLDAEASDPAALYAAALARWDEDTDRRISGCYAAIAILPSGELHCARSPWRAPPIHYSVANGRAVASPLLRCLFAAGVPRSLDWERFADELAIDRREMDQQGWHCDTWRVPLGGFARLRPGRRREEIWHRPPVPLGYGDYDERETVEEALRLLDEAGEKAMAWARKPALSLSGGLDSPLVGSALLRALPSKGRLAAITWVPDRDWKGLSPAGTFGDESLFARVFAGSDQRIDWHVVGRDVGDFDRNARDIFAAMECFAPGLANVGMVHDVHAKARSLDCDAVLTAEFGNATFSETGEAAYREYPELGLWRQYWRLIQARPNDPRPLARKIAALTILPALPASARRVLRKLAHPSRGDLAALYSPLSRKAWREYRARAESRNTRAEWSDYLYDRNRDAAVEKHWRQADGVHHDVDLAFEQLHGLRKRDVTAYRPLVEFCMSLPTRAFAWDGTERRLARRMGERRVPPEIHGNLLYGQHNVDWHERITRSLPKLRSTFAAAEAHPVLGEILDTARLLQMLDAWPQEAGWDWDSDIPRALAVTRALMAARFVGAIEGRNDL